MKPNLLLRQLGIILLLILVTSCSLFEKETIDPDGDPETTELTSLEIGPTIEVASETIPTSGGTVEVDENDAPIDGLEITIPADAFSTSQKFKVSYSEIEDHKFGKNFNPISPMISISYGGGYANGLMTVEVPVKIPKGSFAMGFLYNEETGELEGMPLLEVKEKSVVVGTRHFATSSIEGNGTKSSLIGSTTSQKSGAVGNLIISSISIEKLKQLTDISSGFEPGQDDWEFTNYGSVLSPSGICSGMCLSAMWYYSNEASNGGSDLYHKYDKFTIANYAELWQDNPLGIKLGSMVQLDYQNNDKTYEDAIDAIAKDKTKDSLSWYAFAYSILQTKQPQFIGIMSSAGGGHVLIANEVWMQDSKLWISDPNHPGNRTLNIHYTNKEFEPYYASLNAAENPFNFEYIAYYGKSAVVDWGLLSQRWDELNQGTIGTNQFPENKIWVKDPTGNTEGWELTDDFKTVKDTLDLEIKGNWNSDYAFTVFDAEGYKILPDPLTNYKYTLGGKIVLKEGLNIIGYCINGKTGTNSWDWSDFKWVDVYCQRLKISPDTILNAELNKDYSWEAKYDGPIANPIYEWDFGDGNSFSGSSKKATHNYGPAASGLYTITCKLYDGIVSENALVDSAKAYIMYMGNCYFDIDGATYNLTSIVAGVYLTASDFTTITSQDVTTGITMMLWVPGNNTGTFFWTLSDISMSFQVQDPNKGMVYLGLPGGSTKITKYGETLGNIEGAFSGPILRANFNTGKQDTVLLTNGWFSAFNAGPQ